jgi:hypothetical protein
VGIEGFRPKPAEHVLATDWRRLGDLKGLSGGARRWRA